jgi:hypothetical protein
LSSITHSVVLKAGKWFRLLTSAPLLHGETILEELNSGPYQPAFLEHFFPGSYRVEVRKVNSKAYNGKPSCDPITSEDLLSSEVIRWSTASDQCLVRIKGNDGWLQSFNDIGLIVRNSKKMSKRLAEITRLTGAWLYSEEGSLKVKVIKYKGRKSDVDGISAISTSMAMSCFESNVSASPDWVAKQIDNIKRRKTTVVSFRMLTKNGLIKGNALILPDDMMNGFDVLTFKPNIKPELSTSGWQWVTIEPSYGAIPVKSDDITHAIYRPVKGLYDDDTLMQTMKDMLDYFSLDLQDGKVSEWMLSLVNSGNNLHLDVQERFSSNNGLVPLIQTYVARLDEVGVPLNASQTLMYMGVNGLKNQLIGPGNYSNAWKEKRGRWFPVPWAYSAHIMTKEVLEVFGFKMPKGDFGFYHKQTHCFVVPGSFFEKHLADHGGPDLDDTVKVHIRIVNNQLVAFLLRNPNDFGEWSMIPVREAGPVFHAYTDSPPIVDWDELFTAVPQFSWMMQELEIGSLPGTENLTIGDTFSLDDEIRVRTASQMFPAATGGAVLPKIVHYGSGGGYLPKYYASNENIIDALQQGMATPEDIAVIKEFVSFMFNHIHDNNDGVVDYFWYHTRLIKDIIENHEFVCGKESDSSWLNLHNERNSVVRSSIGSMTDWLNSNIETPDVLNQIEWTLQETVEAPANLDGYVRTSKKYIASRRTHDWVSLLVAKLEKADAELGEEYTNRKVLSLFNQGFIAKSQFPKVNHDQWLYSLSAKSDKQPLDWLIRALQNMPNQ